MKIACKKISIWIDGQKNCFEIGKTFAKKYMTSHITLDTTEKILFVRDEDNIKKLYSFDHFEADIDVNDDKLMNVRNLI